MNLLVAWILMAVTDQQFEEPLKNRADSLVVACSYRHQRLTIGGFKIVTVQAAVACGLRDLLVSQILWYKSLSTELLLS